MVGLINFILVLVCSKHYSIRYDGLKELCIDRLTNLFLRS